MNKASGSSMRVFPVARPIRCLAVLLSCLALAWSAQAAPPASGFAHPGIAHSAESIALVRTRLGAKEQPWTDAWKRLKTSRYAARSWKPRPRAHVERGAYNDPNIGSSDFSNDAAAASVHALCWALTGDTAHAEKAAEILDAWSGTLKSVSNHDARLLVGMSGYKFTVAAELLKHTWNGWPADRQQRFAHMAREIWYPLIKDFYPSANGNWDASMLQTMMAMGVFLNDRAMFDRAKNYFLHGAGNGAIGNYFKPSGQCQESGRDQAHTQMGLDFLAATCETAWIQGIDLYAALDNRLLKGFEYTAKYNLGFDVPYEPYRSYQGRYHYPRISAKARGRLRPMYERVLNHYHNRRGLETPYTGQAAERLRAGGGARGRRRGGADAALDTLMYANRQGTTGVTGYIATGAASMYAWLGPQERLTSGKRGEQVARIVGNEWTGTEPEFRNPGWTRPTATADVPGWRVKPDKKLNPNTRWLREAK